VQPIGKRPMQENLKGLVSRRYLFRGAIAAAGVAAAGTLLPQGGAAEPLGSKDKRKARYQADSAEVRNFYRVNSYPAR
jgi:hypothetical protein